MINFRYIMIGIVVSTTLAVTIIGQLAGASWGVAVGTCGILSALMVASYQIVKSLQTVLQRLAGVLKQQERLMFRQEQIESSQRSLRAEVESSATSDAVPPGLRLACEEMTLASRSLTVPQAHFDQLLRTISANTQRTEAALDDAVIQLQSQIQRSNSL